MKMTKPPLKTKHLSPIRSWIGYVVGFPWMLLFPALLTLLLALITRNKKAIADRTALLTVMFKGADLYCSLIWFLAGFYNTATPNKPPKAFGVDKKGFDVHRGTLSISGLDFPYGIGDFDAKEQMMLYRKAFYRTLAWIPKMRADHRPLPPIEEYQKLIREVFGPTFVATRPIIGDPDSPETLRAYLTDDYGAPWLSRVGNRFIADLSHWDDLNVIDPGRYERYGGRLEFNEDLTDVSITWQGERYTPEHPEWSRVRYVLMTTILIAVVVEQHTIHIHYQNAALFGFATRKHLQSDHPVYRLLRPFTIETISINEHANYLIISKCGILYRGTSLTWDSLEKLYGHAARSYRHEPMPKYLNRMGLLEPDGSAADGVVFAEESLLVYAIIERFVCNYLSIYYHDEQSVDEDIQIEQFWSAIVHGLPDTAGLEATPSYERLVDLIATFIWNATFWHDYTSQTGNSLYDYRLAGVLAKRTDVYGSIYPNIQEQLITLLAHQLTTVQGPKVIDNFDHFWLDDSARHVAQRFQQDLQEYKAGLVDRNAKRDRPFEAFNPDIIESSVQT